jgi:hypothetical protein
MTYAGLFTPHHIATLADWLDEKRQLLVQIELPHSGGSGSYATVRSLVELKRIVESVTNPEIEIFIWKNRTERELENADEPDDLEWIYSHPDEVMYLSVKKNRNFSRSYANDPEKYREVLEQWFKP